MQILQKLTSGSDWLLFSFLILKRDPFIFKVQHMAAKDHAGGTANAE